MRSKNKDKIPIKGPKAKNIKPKDQLTICTKEGNKLIENRVIPKPTEVWIKKII